MIHHVFVTFIFIISINAHASYIIKQGQYQNSYFTLADISIDFGKNLYIADTHPCSDKTTEEWNTIKNLTMTCEDYCDYSPKGSDCGISSVGDCECPHRDQYCDELVFDWVHLKNGDFINVRQRTKIRRMRLFIDDYEGYYLRMTTHVGEVDVDAGSTLFVDTVSINYFTIHTNSIFTGNDARSYKSGVSICPEDEGFKPGTYFITFRCFEHTECNYDVEVIKRKSIPPIIDSCEGMPTPENVTCIPDSVAVVTQILSRRQTYIHFFPDEPQSIRFFSVDLVTRPITVWTVSISSDLEGKNIIYGLNLQGNHRVTLNVDNSTEKLFIHYYHGEVDYGYTKPLRITVTSNREKLELLPIESFPSWDTRLRLSRAFDLVCDNQIVKACSANRFIGEIMEECEPMMYFLRTTTDEASMNYFWPPAPGTTFTVDSDIQYIEEGVVDSKKISLLLFLNEKKNGLFTEFYDINFLETCFLKPKGILVFDDSTSPTKNMPVVSRKSECDLKNYEMALINIQERILALESSEDQSSLLQNTMFAHMSYFHSSIQACVNEVDDIIKINEVSTFTVQTKECLSVNEEERLTDPCCNPDLLLDECCVEHDKQVSINEYTYDSTTEKCEDNAECVDSYLADYYALDLDRCDQLKENERQYLQERTSFWPECVQQIFHIEALQNGIPCIDNSDCTDGICDIVSRICLIDTEVLSEYFLDCIIPKLPPFLQKTISGTTQTQKKATILREFSPLGCKTLYYDILQTSHYLKFRHCDDYCADPPAVLYPFVDNIAESCRTLGFCQFEVQWSVFGYNEGLCMENGFCNIVEEKGSCTRPGNGFCGVCFGEHCYEQKKNGTSYDENECASLELCLTPEGEIVDLPYASCVNLEKCYLESDTNYEIDCSSDGMCEVLVDLFPNGTETACYVPSNPNGLIRCFFMSLQDVRGGCLSNILSEVECNSRGGIFINKGDVQSLNEESCYDFMRSCIYPVAQENYIGMNWPLVVSNSNEYCPACGLDEAPLFNWYPKMSIKGMPMTPEWRTPKTITPEWTNTLDYTQLGDFIRNEILKNFRYFKQTELICRIATPTEILKNVLCSCKGNCEKANITTPIGIGRVCQGDTVEIYTVPHKFVSNPDAYVENFCDDLRFYSISSSEYLIGESGGLTGIFRLKGEEGSYSVRNIKGAILGYLKSDGVSIEHASAISSFTLCLFPKLSLLDLEAEVVKWDFAYTDYHEGAVLKDLVPMSLDLQRTEDGYYCTEIKNDESGRFYFLYTTEVEVDGDLQSLEPTYLTTVESFVLILVIAVYFLVLAMGIAAFIVIIKEESYLQGKSFAVMLFFLSPACRIVHLLIVLFSQGRLPLSGLAELPTFFLLSGSLMLSFIFFFIVESSEKSQLSDHENRTVLKLFGYSTVPLFFMFLALNIIYNLLPSEPSRLVSCNGRVDTGPNLFTGRSITLYIYRGLMALVSFIITLIVIFWGLSLTTRIRRQEKLNKEGTRSYTLIGLTLTTSLFLVIQGILFIVISFYEANLIVSAILLTIVECIPCGTAFYFLELYNDESPTESEE